MKMKIQHAKAVLKGKFIEIYTYIKKENSNK